MAWDVQHALHAREQLDDIRDDHARAVVTRVLDAFEQRVVPHWPLLRAQVAHTDLTVDNALTDDRGFVTGIIDFGDMSHTALVSDIASLLDSVCRRPRGARSCCAPPGLVLDGYERRVPLEDRELGARRRLGGTLAGDQRSRSAPGASPRELEEPEFAERYNAIALKTLTTLEAAGWDVVARALGAEGAREPDPSLAARRAAAFGPAVDPLFYAEPIEVLRAEACGSPTPPAARSSTPTTTSRASGTRTRGSVRDRPPEPSHQHPHALPAPERDRARGAPHATCPPELDTVLLVNSGSEANDLAWRMATAVTGNRGGLCTDFAYHGITEAIAALSPEGWFGAPGPDHVETWAPDGDATALDARDRAPRRAATRPPRPSSTASSPATASSTLDPAYVQALVGATRKAGGLWIADEVQSATAAPARTCGASSASASSRTSSPSASRWATATRSRRSSRSDIVAQLVGHRSSAPSAATPSARPPPSRCST